MCVSSALRRQLRDLLPRTARLGPHRVGAALPRRRRRSRVTRVTENAPRVVPTTSPSGRAEPWASATSDDPRPAPASLLLCLRVSSSTMSLEQAGRRSFNVITLERSCGGIFVGSWGKDSRCPLRTSARCCRRHPHRGRAAGPAGHTCRHPLQRARRPCRSPSAATYVLLEQEGILAPLCGGAVRRRQLRDKVSLGFDMSADPQTAQEGPRLGLTRGGHDGASEHRLPRARPRPHPISCATSTPTLRRRVVQPNTSAAVAASRGLRSRSSFWAVSTGPSSRRSRRLAARHDPAVQRRQGLPGRRLH